MKRAAVLALLFAAGALVAWAPAAAACPVCYGEAEAPVFDAARWSVVFLGGLTYVLLAGGVTVVFALRRRVRAALAEGPTTEPLPFAPTAARKPKEP